MYSATPIPLLRRNIMPTGGELYHGTCVSSVGCVVNTWFQVLFV